MPDTGEPEVRTSSWSDTKPASCVFFSCACFCFVGGVVFLTLQSAADLWEMVPCTNPFFSESFRKNESRTTFSPSSLRTSTLTPSKQNEDSPKGWTRKFGDDSSLCDAQWTWSGIEKFWTVSRSSATHKEFSIQRGFNERKRLAAEWYRGEPCSQNGGIQKGAAVVIVRSTDRYSPNVWHRTTALFEAWITPKVLQLKKILPDSASIYYNVPPFGDRSLTNDPGPYQWQLLGQTTTQTCGFEDRVVAPTDGFLWDLAWDIHLVCARSSNLWREFQAVPLSFA